MLKLTLPPLLLCPFAFLYKEWVWVWFINIIVCIWWEPMESYSPRERVIASSFNCNHRKKPFPLPPCFYCSMVMSHIFNRTFLISAKIVFSFHKLSEVSFLSTHEIARTIIDNRINSTHYTFYQKLSLINFFLLLLLLSSDSFFQNLFNS